MGSDAGKSTKTSTSSVSTTNTANVVVSKGTDAVALAGAMGNVFNSLVAQLGAQQSDYLNQARTALNDIGVGGVATAAIEEGFETGYETSTGAATTTPAAQALKPLLLAAVVLGGVYFLSKRKGG